MRASRRAGGAWRRQRGVSLIELMVALAIGLLTVAVALGALMASRGISGTVNDAAQLQQQAAYALRVIGQQVRQAGSTQLNLKAGSDPATNPTPSPEDPVAFLMTGYSAITNVVSGTDSPVTLAVGYSNYMEPNVTNQNSLFRTCLGNGGTLLDSGALKYPLITSTFSFKNNELVCNDGTTSGTQALIQNVADFQVAYWVQQSGPGVPTVFRTNAAGVNNNWGAVYAVEVCLELVGSERTDLPKDDSTTYKNCNGDDVKFADDPRLHMVFRNTFQIRSQGLFFSS